jgi:hypothetical protein
MPPATFLTKVGNQSGVVVWGEVVAWVARAVMQGCQRNKDLGQLIGLEDKDQTWQ